MLSAFVHGHGARLLRQPSALLAGAALVVGVAAAYLGGGDCSAGERPGAYGAFVCYAPEALIFMLPAVAAVAGGVVVAAGRSSGEDMVYAVRGLAGARLALARGLAGSVAAAVVMLVAGLVIVALALVVLPDRPELERPPGITMVPGFERPEAGVPVPALWRSAPLAGDLLAVAVYALAAAALAAVGNAVGQLIAQPAAAFAAPVLLVLSAQVAPLPGWGEWLSGYAYLDLMPVDGTMTAVPGEWRLPVLVGVWSAVLAAGLAVLVLVARRQERSA